MASDKDASKNKSKEAAVPDREATDAAADGEVAPKSSSRFGFLLTKKMLMFVVAPAVLLLVLGGAVFLFGGGEEATAVSGETGAHGGLAEVEGHPVFFEVPDILVNVTSSGGKPVYLKLAVSLELEGADETAVAHLEPIMPRVIDQLQTYLRELRIEDLSGSAAMFRLKEELLRRVNLAAEPVKVKSVLFREMIIQ